LAIEPLERRRRDGFDPRRQRRKVKIHPSSLSEDRAAGYRVPLTVLQREWIHHAGGENRSRRVSGATKENAERFHRFIVFFLPHTRLHERN
jgi:hypothetical protein